MSPPRGCIILGMSETSAPVGDFERYFDRVDDPVTMYLYYHRFGDTPRIAEWDESQQIALDLLTRRHYAGEKDGAIIREQGTYVVAKPGERQNVWHAASVLESQLGSYDGKVTVSPIPMPIANFRDFVDTTGSLLHQLNTEGSIRKTGLYRYELKESIERLVNDHGIANRFPDPRHDANLERSRDYLKTYFPADASFAREIFDVSAGMGVSILSMLD